VADLVFRDVFSGLFVVLALVALGLSRSRRFLTWYGRWFARNNLAWVDATLVGEFDAQLRRGLRFAATGFFALGPVVWWLVGRDQPPGAFPEPIAFLALMLVVQAPVMGLPFLYPVRSNVARTGFSRGRAVELRDYLPPVERRAALIAGFCSLALAGVMFVKWLFVRGPVGTGGFDPGVLLCLGAVCIGLAELMASSLVRKPMPAVDAAHLYWQDARRSDAIRGFYRAAILQVPLVWGAAAAQLGHGGSAVVDFPVFIGVLGPGFTFPIWSLIYQVSLSEKPDSRWFRRQLWPDLPRGSGAATRRRTPSVRDLSDRAATGFAGSRPAGTSGRSYRRPTEAAPRTERQAVRATRRGLAVFPVACRLNCLSSGTRRPDDPATRRPGDPATRRPGDPTTRRPGDPATRRPGDPATRRPGDPATRRPGDPATRATRATRATPTRRAGPGSHHRAARRCASAWTRGR